MDRQNQNERYRRGQDQADLSFRNQETGYGRAQDQASLDRQNAADAYAREQDLVDLGFRNQETSFDQRMGAAVLNTRQTQAENDSALLDARLQAMDEIANPTETAGPGDTNSDGTLSDEERVNQTLSAEAVDLGFGGADDEPGGMDRPYLMDTATKARMEQDGYIFTEEDPIPATANETPERRYRDQDGNVWFIRRDT